jgi:hypothetical protein
MGGSGLQRLGGGDALAGSAAGAEISAITTIWAADHIYRLMSAKQHLL